MASTSFFDQSRPSALRRMFSAIGAGLETYMESQARTEQVRRLGAKSDAELAEMGLKREDIIRHVFRDRLFM